MRKPVISLGQKKHIISCELDGSHVYRFASELHEISSGENSFIDQELNAGRDSPFVLEDSGGDHLVYIPS
ncbi:Collagen Alpha-5(Vi) Chain [Manis pentadactyla]|nr:Collagen Alpha-5(Vi) Chain [Manis pentadactyla]